MHMVRAALALATVASLVGARTASAQQAAPPRPPQMLHPAAGKADCLSCHGKGANEHITSVPDSHRYGNGACGMCHKPIAATPPAAKHALDEAHADCRHCHALAAEGAAPAAPGTAPASPASHAKFHASTCRLCHQPAQPAAPGGDHDDRAR